MSDEWKAEVESIKDATELSPNDKDAKLRLVGSRYTARFLDLARTHLDDGLWVDCLIWTTVEGTPGDEFDAMFDILETNAGRLSDPFQLQLSMSQLIPLQSERINPALSAISESHPNGELRGAALYALAARTKLQAEETGNELGLANAKRLLEQVVVEYPDVRTYAGENLKNAKSLLEHLQSPLAITKLAPSTQGRTIAGNEFDLETSIRGKIAVISFSGHWCAPCVAMHSTQKEIVAKFSEDAVVIVEMNSDDDGSLENVRKKMDSDGLKWTVVTDGRSGPISEQWRVTEWPTYYVIDSSGRIRHRVVGNIGQRLLILVEELVSNGKQ